MPKIHFAGVSELFPHPLLERVGMMQSLAHHYVKRTAKAGKNRAEVRERAEELVADNAAMIDSVRQHGVLEPLKVCRIPASESYPGCRWVYYIVDGRNRWMSAKACNLRHVPVIRIRVEDAPAVIAATVAARRHYTKGATAYLAVLLNPEIAIENTPGRKSRTECAIEPVTLEGLAKKFSVSLRLLVQAGELFRLLNSHPRYQADAEAAVWSGDGLGGILAGVKSLIATGAKTNQSADAKRAMAAWTFTNKACGQLSSAWERWADLGTEQRETATARLRETLAAAPEDIRSLLKSLA